MVNSTITFWGTLVEIFHADATAVKDSGLTDALAFIGVLNLVDPIHITFINTIVLQTDRALAPGCGCMPIVHGPQRLEFLYLHSDQILDQVFRVLRWRRPIFVPADQQERSTDDDKEND